MIISIYVAALLLLLIGRGPYWIVLIYSLIRLYALLINEL